MDLHSFDCHPSPLCLGHPVVKHCPELLLNWLAAIWFGGIFPLWEISSLDRGQSNHRSSVERTSVPLNSNEVILLISVFVYLQVSQSEWDIWIHCSLLSLIYMIISGRVLSFPMHLYLLMCFGCESNLPYIAWSTNTIYSKCFLNVI